MAEGTGLLNRRMGDSLYRGFESLSLRYPDGLPSAGEASLFSLDLLQIFRVSFVVWIRSSMDRAPVYGTGG